MQALRKHRIVTGLAYGGSDLKGIMWDIWEAVNMDGEDEVAGE